MQAKPVIRSKTLWWQALTVVGTLFASATPIGTDWKTYVGIIAVNAIGNTILRLRTTQPVAINPQPVIPNNPFPPPRPDMDTAGPTPDDYYANQKKGS